MKEIECTEEGCNGWVFGILPTSLSFSREPAYPCDECGRLYWPGGAPVFTEEGEKIFRQGDVVRTEPLSLVPTEPELFI